MDEIPHEPGCEGGKKQQGCGERPPGSERTHEANDSDYPGISRASRRARRAARVAERGCPVLGPLGKVAREQPVTRRGREFFGGMALVAGVLFRPAAFFLGRPPCWQSTRTGVVVGALQTDRQAPDAGTSCARPSRRPSRRPGPEPSARRSTLCIEAVVIGDSRRRLAGAGLTPRGDRRRGPHGMSSCRQNSTNGSTITLPDA
jgi:hypothetical protein